MSVSGCFRPKYNVTTEEQLSYGIYTPNYWSCTECGSFTDMYSFIEHWPTCSQIGKKICPGIVYPIPRKGRNSRGSRKNRRGSRKNRKSRRGTRRN